MLSLLIVTAALAGAAPDLSNSSIPRLDGTATSSGRCATPSPSRDEANAMQRRISSLRGLRASSAGVTIGVAFHVVTCGGQGDVTSSQIAEQLRVLNRAYRGTGFSFVLSSVDRTEDCEWFSGSLKWSVEKKMKKALAIDPAHRLNVYLVEPAFGVIGWAYYPQTFREDNFMHGVAVHYGTLPDGFLAPFNLGGTLAHEVGHYLGLFHTFDGGCVAPGDFIDDTPFEASPAFGCPVGRNTCPQPGDDPIHNYMDYTDDACYSELTDDQAERMHAIVAAYRPSLFSGAALAARGTDSDPAVEAARSGNATGLAFRGAWPNPFSGVATLRFVLPAEGHVTLAVFDVAGGRVATLADGVMPAGEQSVILRAGTLRPGTYFASLRFGGEVLTRPVVLVP